MDILLIVVGILCLLIGLAGCVLPMIPGPPVAYAGLLLLHFTEGTGFTSSQLIFWLLLVVLAQVIDYVMPMWGSKFSGGGKMGSRGCLAGTVAGLFFMPWGLIVGPFLGAFIGTWLELRDTGAAFKSGIGSLFGFLFGTLLKCLLCGYFLWQFVAHLC